MTRGGFSGRGNRRGGRGGSFRDDRGPGRYDIVIVINFKRRSVGGGFKGSRDVEVTRGPRRGGFGG